MPGSFGASPDPTHHERSVAMQESNPVVHQSREDARDGATSAPVARPLNLSPRPLPKRDPRRGRHWINAATRTDHTVKYLLAKYEAEYHITDVQARLAAAERSAS